MVDQVLELAISNGLWAVLFLFLFVYQLKDSNKREKNYVVLINKLTNEVAILKKVDSNLQTVSTNVLSIKKVLFKK